MAALSKILRSAEGDLVMFWCPGCDGAHNVRAIAGQPQSDRYWGWDGNVDKPTFEPSILVRYGDPGPRCHSFVRGGRIQFLSDCSHSLAGQTVDLPEWPE